MDLITGAGLLYKRIQRALAHNKIELGVLYTIQIQTTTMDRSIHSAMTTTVGTATRRLCCDTGLTNLLKLRDRAFG